MISPAMGAELAVRAERILLDLAADADRKGIRFSDHVADFLDAAPRSIAFGVGLYLVMMTNADPGWVEWRRRSS